MSQENENKKDVLRRWRIANIITTGVVFAAVTVCLFTLERPTVSETENRSLTEFPEFSSQSLFSGRYTDQISEYFNDTVPMRDTFKKIAASIRNGMGLSLSGAKVYGGLSAITTEATSEPAQTVQTEASAPASDSAVSDLPEVTTTAPIPVETTTTTHNPANEIAEGVYTNGQIVVFQDGHWRGISMYGGGTGSNYAAYLNAFAEDLGDDIKVYSMVVPTSGAYYTPINFTEYNASHLDSINSINSQLSDKVVPVDAYSVLGEHISEPIYTRTDHHWESLGAYYAAQEFAETAGVPFADLSTYKEVTVDGYVGTLYSFTEDANLLNDPEQFIYYKPQNDYTCYYYDTAYTADSMFTFPLFVDQPVSQSYSMFMGGDAKIVRVETDVANGRKLAVFKDSYGNAEIPFYTGSFEEIYVLDIRYFDLNAVEFLKNQGITDLLFTMCTFSAVGVNAENIDVIRTQ